MSHSEEENISFDDQGYNVWLWAPFGATGCNKIAQYRIYHRVVPNPTNNNAITS